MARLSLLLLSVAAMVAADFTEAEAPMAQEVFTEEAGSGEEDFMVGECSTVAAAFMGAEDSMEEVGFEAAGFTVEVVSEAGVGSAEELSAAAGFEAEPVFVAEPSAAVSAEAFVAMALGAVSAFADEALDGEAGAGVGA